MVAYYFCLFPLLQTLPLSIWEGGLTCNEVMLRHLFQELAKSCEAYNLFQNFNNYNRWGPLEENTEMIRFVYGILILSIME
jgi:hypothetical protein